jgi:hypothetical protein
MTQKEAKELSLELWAYLAKHSEITDKSQLSEYIYSIIKNCDRNCPLCEVFSRSCMGCPLREAGEKCANTKSAWNKWAGSFFHEKRRKQAAERIVEIISAWEPEDAQ